MLKAKAQSVCTVKMKILFDHLNLKRFPPHKNYFSGFPRSGPPIMHKERVASSFFNFSMFLGTQEFTINMMMVNMIIIMTFAFFSARVS